MITLQDYLNAELEYDIREQKRGFRYHAIAYCLVNSLLIVLNILLIIFTSDDFVWFAFPLVGWGIGLTFHYLYGVRWVDRVAREHQEKVEQLAERKLAA